MIRTSADAREIELAAPAREQRLPQPALRRLSQLGILRDDRLRLAPRLLEDRGVPQQIGDAELRQSGLPRAEEFAGAAQLQVDLRDLEAVVGLDHRAHTALGVLAETAAREEDAVGLPRPPTDA